MNDQKLRLCTNLYANMRAAGQTSFGVKLASGYFTSGLVGPASSVHSLLKDKKQKQKKVEMWGPVVVVGGGGERGSTDGHVILRLIWPTPSSASGAEVGAGQRGCALYYSL